MFIYLLAYLDRANLGVAKLSMQVDLGFNDAVIGFGAGVFFLGFLLLNIPATLLVERWSARKLLAIITISWGLVASVTGFIGTHIFGSLSITTQFYGLRTLLGIAEAGFFPGVIVYISHWYRPEDRPRAKGYFMVSQSIAVATGIPLSRWILENIHWAGLASWRWVFVLEGILPFFMGFVTLWYLNDRPGSARGSPMTKSPGCSPSSKPMTRVKPRLIESASSTLSAIRRRFCSPQYSSSWSPATRRSSSSSRPLPTR